MTQQLPLNPKILRWARETAGLSTEDVATSLGRKKITGSVIADWESGIGSPNYVQLEELAHSIFRRPLAVFFFPVVPNEETPKADFRTLPDAIVDALPPSIVKLYRKAKFFQINLEELYEGSKPPGALLLDKFELKKESHFQTIAKEIRGALGIPIEEQTKWRSTETALKRWRGALEGAGVFVFKDAFRNNDYSGFCLFSDKYPVVYVNNSMPDSRQVFTLFHELAHLLLRLGGIDFRSRESLGSLKGYYLDVEIICNRFANEFLVPRDEFDSLEKGVSENQIEYLAEYFSVSREVVLRNYLETGLVGADYYEKMAAKWASQAKVEKDEGSGGSYYYNTRAYLGEKYINLVYTRYYQNRITIENVAEYLNVKAKNLPTFEHVVIERGKP